MTRAAATAVDLHPLIAERWSPRSFDADATVAANDILAVLEAGRWAPSANNSQPWRFAVVGREDAYFPQTVEALAGFNRQWAPRASAFIIIGAESTDADGNQRRWADYDTGIAAGLMTVQAHALGLHVHQMGGFDPDALHSLLGFNGRTHLLAVMAIGRRSEPHQLEGELRTREESPRQRQDLASVVVRGLPSVAEGHR